MRGKKGELLYLGKGDFLGGGFLVKKVKRSGLC